MSASPNKTCQDFIQKYFHINNILQNTRVPILQKKKKNQKNKQTKKKHFDKDCTIKYEYDKWLSYWQMTQMHLCTVQDECVYEWLNT